MFPRLAATCGVLCLVVLPVLAQPVAGGQALPPVDLLLTGGKVFTADSSRPWVEAVAIRGDRIVAVGMAAELARLRGPRTRVVSLQGRVVIPGINDTHTHLGYLRAVGPAVASDGDWMQGASPRMLLDSLAALARRTPKGTWLRSEMGMRVRLDTTLRRGALDRVAPDHPVILVASYGHGSMVNTRALRTMGIADTAPDPPGGWYERAPATRVITGLLDGAAQSAAWDAYFSSAPARVAANLRAVAGEAAALGITTLQHMASPFGRAAAVRVFADAALPVRVRVIQWPFSGPRGDWNRVANRRLAPLVHVSGVKYVVDGTGIEQWSLSRRAYDGHADWYGRVYWSMDALRPRVELALQHGDQPMFHVTGDSTVVLMLALLRELAPDSVWRARRPRFEHAPGLTGDLVPGARQMGIVVSQPRAGPAQVRMWQRGGLVVTYGSDADPGNPFETLRDWTTPQDSTGAISREDALTMFTRNSAYAEFAEREKGMLAPGMLADLAVLSQDVFTVPAEALPATRSLLTLVGGRIVHDALDRRAATRPKLR